jgi:hypothetical protein
MPNPSIATAAQSAPTRSPTFKLLLAGLAAFLLTSASSAQEIVTPPVNGAPGFFADVSLHVEKLDCDLRRQCTATARGTYLGQAVGLKVVIGAMRGNRRGVAYRSTGADSDRLLQALAGLYRVRPAGAHFAREVFADAVLLEGDVANPASGPLKLKVFFNADGPESAYAEAYTNYFPAKHVLVIAEKDVDYRTTLIKLFSAP